MVWWEHTGGRWMSGQDDLGGLFPSWWFCDSIFFFFFWWAVAFKLFYIKLAQHCVRSLAIQNFVFRFLAFSNMWHSPAPGAYLTVSYPTAAARYSSIRPLCYPTAHRFTSSGFLAVGVPVLCRGVGLDNFWGSLLTQAILYFYDIFCFPSRQNYSLTQLKNGNAWNQYSPSK